ncbi:response regulator transcription factor [Cohaesibacter celericrescens]|uniref:Two-component system response regulator n=1 Tax=Cohaesibacter celericrescens TaxID=2067669 RepID=A0A2N5XME9_9HYPH|nr:response regulator [Cohaesibacter celericrescens]PLW75620.1 two-component system response regulator [Cohaesibacter celericrescens]
MTKSVLVVDDEASISFALEHLMKSEGYNVTTANDGNKAIEQATTSRPDVILLDVSLPGRDGFDVCQTIHSAPTTCDVKIIMMSAHSRDIEIEKGMALGASAYLTKPFSMGMVAQTVRDVLAGDHS